MKNKLPPYNEFLEETVITFDKMGLISVDPNKSFTIHDIWDRKWDELKKKGTPAQKHFIKVFIDDARRKNTVFVGLDTDIKEVFEYVQMHKPIPYEQVAKKFPKAVYALPMLLKAQVISEEDVPITDEKLLKKLEDEADKKFAGKF